MVKLRLFEQNFGKKELLEVIDENELVTFIDKHKKVIRSKYPKYSYLSFEFESIEVDDHLIVFNVHYSFNNSSYFSTKMLKESHTVLIKKV